MEWHFDICVNMPVAWNSIKVKHVCEKRSECVWERECQIQEWRETQSHFCLLHFANEWHFSFSALIIKILSWHHNDKSMCSVSLYTHSFALLCSIQNTMSLIDCTMTEPMHNEPHTKCTAYRECVAYLNGEKLKRQNGAHEQQQQKCVAVSCSMIHHLIVVVGCSSLSLYSQFVSLIASN